MADPVLEKILKQTEEDAQIAVPRSNHDKTKNLKDDGPMHPELEKYKAAIPEETTEPTEISDELQIKLFVEEANLVYFSKLEFKKTLFETELIKRSDGEQLFIQMDETHFTVARGEEKTPVMKAKWKFIGQYGFHPATKNYFWSWGWYAVPPTISETTQNQDAAKNVDEYAELKGALSKLPEDIKEIAKHSIITFQDPTLVSYIQAFLCETMPLDYVKVFPAEEPETFSALGLYNVQWLVEVLEPNLEADLSKELDKIVLTTPSPDENREKDAEAHEKKLIENHETQKQD
jgi:hypothetical protein